MDRNTDHQLAIIAAAKERGLDPSRLTQSQYRSLALAIRTAKEKVADATAAIISRGLTGLNLRVVPDVVAEQNAAVCRSNQCGKFRTLARGRGPAQEACDACNCHSKWLKSKWRDASEKCPLKQPLWDNTNKQSVIIDAAKE